MTTNSQVTEIGKDMTTNFQVTEIGKDMTTNSQVTEIGKDMTTKYDTSRKNNCRAKRSRPKLLQSARAIFSGSCFCGD